MSEIDDRFWAKVDKGGPVHPILGTPCWLWTRYVSPSDGYGRFSPKAGDCRLAHRVAYALGVGEVPGGLELDHLCRVRSCVNPAHLEPVTRRVNVQRGLAPKVCGQHQRDKTHCPKGHPLSGDNLLTERNRCGGICRRCATCRKAQRLERSLR